MTVVEIEIQSQSLEGFPDLVEVGHVHPSFQIGLVVFISDVETSLKNTPQDVKIRDLSSTAAQKIFQEPLCRENLYTQT